MIKITKAGYLYTAVTIVIGFSAVNTANNLVYIIAAALLSYMLVSGIFGKHNLFTVDVDLEYPDEMFAGLPVPVKVILINNRKLLPAFLIKVTVDGQQVIFPFVDVRQRKASYCSVVYDQRGEHEVRRIQISSVFPFNFFTRYRTLSGKQTRIVVFARPRSCSLPLAGALRNRSRGAETTNSVGLDADLISIRDYLPSDPLKYIAWKSTAKTGKLKTKELSTDELQHVIIDFDNLEIRDLEHRISCTTFTILKLMRSGVPVGLIIDGERLRPDISTAHRINMLRKLALYGQDQVHS